MKPNFRPLPSAADLREWYSFNPLNGKIYSRRRNRKSALGCLDRKGYLILMAAGRQLFIHRVIWKWMTGNDPVGSIDHKNQVRHDNSIWNLRDVSVRDQNRNRSNVRLNPEKVLLIRARLASGEKAPTIAPDFGISPEAVTAIRTGRTWKDVQLPNLCAA